MKIIKNTVNKCFCGLKPVYKKSAFKFNTTPHIYLCPHSDGYKNIKERDIATFMAYGNTKSNALQNWNKIFKKY